MMVSDKYNFIGDSNGVKLHRLITFVKRNDVHEKVVYIKYLIRKGESKG